MEIPYSPRMKTFVFKDVLLLKLYIFPLIGAFVVAPIVLTPLLFFNSSSLPVLMGSCTVGFAVMFAIFNRLRKTVEITFDAQHITFTINGVATHHLKTDLIGFYSFDYNTAATSTISMRFDFTDGTKMDISDYLATGKYISEKNRMLTNFVDTAQEELGFTKVSVNKARTLGKIGNVWYAKPPISN